MPSQFLPKPPSFELTMHVPGPLAKQIFDAAVEYSGNVLRTNMKMAYCIIGHYLGRVWYEQKAILRNDPDPFMLNEKNQDSINRYTYQHRIITLADALFALRGAENFDALCERFKTRLSQVRSCFTEASVAKIFSDAGFEISIVVESGVKGQDFDFAACWSDQVINVEVTAKVGGELSVETVLNSLRQKRKQLPSGGAAIIYVVIPEAWTRDGKAEKTFGEAVARFFGSTGRVNAVVITWEATFDLNGAHIVVLAYRPYENTDAREPIDDSSFLHEAHALGDLNTFRERITNEPERVQSELEGTIGDPHTSFYRWYLENKP